MHYLPLLPLLRSFRSERTPQTDSLGGVDDDEDDSVPRIVPSPTAAASASAIAVTPSPEAPASRHVLSAFDLSPVSPSSYEPIARSVIYYSSSSSSAASSSCSLTDDTQHLTMRSPSSSSSCAPPSPPLPQVVKETHYINVDYDPISGRKMLNTYEIIRELGRGQHGKVKLGRDLTTGDFVAIKIMNRTGRPRLGRPMRPGSTQEDKIRREIAILKTCNHPHIVRLREVLDDSNSNKIFLVLEYVELGEIKWTTEDGNPAMTVDYARSIFRDVVLGLEYLHYKGIIHRDIKPANLLMTSEGNAKISDFGVSYISGLSGEDDELELAKTAGTPAFFAPELCYNDPDLPRPQITNKIDIWALGVTLFCLIYGKCPFTADNEFELFNVIAKEPVVFPDNVDLPDEAKNLILNLLEKNPDKRMSIAEIKKNPWVLEGMTDDKRTEFLSQALLSR